MWDQLQFRQVATRPSAVRLAASAGCDSQSENPSKDAGRPKKLRGVAKSRHELQFLRQLFAAPHPVALAFTPEQKAKRLAGGVNRNPRGKPRRDCGAWGKRSRLSCERRRR